MSAVLKFSTIIIFILILFGSFDLAQTANIIPSGPEKQITGLPLIRNYLPAEYDASPQNWSLAKDKRGLMYFANTGGVLEYDGIDWNLIEVKNEVARTLSIDDNGIIYVGGVDEFGYLRPDSIGQMRYESLVPLLPEDEKEFGDIWST